ncbi:MAG: type IV pilus assembly protein PilM [Candidatus Pacebacteria bacterium]|nr:type IV pilus assembly protein PilM [Candidatus Paceibacterota bacterium]
MFDFLNLKQKAFGLDISDFSLKIAKLRKQGQFFSVSSFKEMPLEAGIVRKGEIRDEDKLAEAIKKSVRDVQGEKLQTKDAIISLPEEKSFLRIIQMPKLSGEDLRSAIVLEAENHIPLPMEEVYFDYQAIAPLYDHLDHLDVLIVGFPRKIIDSYVSCLKKANIRPVALELESLAITRALIEKEVSTHPVFMLDFGLSKTNLIIFSGNSVKFTFFLPVSSQELTEAIARSMQIDLVKAENLKKQYGLEGKADKTGEEVFNALIPPLTDLIEQIKKYLDYYRTRPQHEHLPPDAIKEEIILVCGGGAKLKGLTDFLSSQLKIAVKIGNPWTNILPSASQPKEKALIYEKEESLSYTTVLGLALRGIKEND